MCHWGITQWPHWSTRSRARTRSTRLLRSGALITPSMRASTTGSSMPIRLRLPGRPAKSEPQ